MALFGLSKELINAKEIYDKSQKGNLRALFIEHCEDDSKKDTKLCTIRLTEEKENTKKPIYRLIIETVDNEVYKIVLQ